MNDYHRSTTVHYHADGYGPARPAINVKDRHSGMDLIALERLVGDAAVVLGESVTDTLRNIAYERVASDFWRAAQEMAEEKLGLGEITQEGRSGGWLVFTDFDPRTHPTEVAESDDEQDRTVEVWLAGYRVMTEWADAYIADAPRKVAALAQSLAMDALGERPAYRMFATERLVR